VKRLGILLAAVSLIAAAPAPRPVVSIETGWPPTEVELSAVGRTIALRTPGGGVQLRSLIDGKVTGEVGGDPQPVASFRLSADASLLVLRRGSSAEVWRLKGLAKRNEFPLQADQLDSLALAPSGRFVATSWRPDVRVFDTASGKQIAHWALPVGEAWTMAFTADESGLLIGGTNASLYLLDLASSKIRAQNDELPMATFAVAPIDGGRRFLAAGGYNLLETLDGATLRRVGSPMPLGPAVGLLPDPRGGRGFAALMDINNNDLAPRAVAWSASGVRAIAPLVIGGALDERGRVVYVVPTEKGVEIHRFAGD
jgi:hypothetical protein